MPGPPSNPNSRRRNTSTVHILPAEGRAGRPPAVPRRYKLGPAGRAWWRWAWKLPQATKWDDGALYAAARRAELEDHLDAIKFKDDVDLDDLLAGAEPDAIKRVEWALTQLKRSASGATTLMKEQRELEDRLGLNPKALAALRWVIGEPKPDEQEEAGVANIADYRARLG